MTEPRHSVAVAGVVIDDHRRFLLMKRRGHGNWEPPGGVLELEETLEQGVMREVLEETGIEVQPERLTGVYKNVEKGIISIVFRCTLRAGDPTPTDEAVEVRWYDIDECHRLLLDEYAGWVKDALRDDEADSRAQTGTIKGASASPKG
jgi:8-oxo-dGTP diphosphatase